MAIAGWDSTKRIKIAIPGQASDLVDFPVLVYLSISSGVTGFDCSAIFAELGSSSLKIAVEDADTGNQCYVEVESWDAANKRATLHVRVPLIPASGGTYIWLYYDNTQADNATYVGNTGDSPAQQVWDSNFLAVYHMAQDPSGTAPQVIDSTSNNNDATTNGAMTSADLVDGPTGKGLNLDGGDDYLDIANGPDNAAALTVEGFVSLSGYGGGAGVPCVIAKWDAVDSYFFAIADGDARPAGTVRFYTYTSAGVEAYSSGKVQLATPTYVAGSYDGSAVRTYLAGSLDGSASQSGSLVTGSGKGKIGRLNDANASSITGDVYEVRVSAIARTADWIKATNASMLDALVTFSAAAIEVISVLDQVYDLEAAMVRAAMAQVYSLTFDLQALLAQVYGIKLLNLLRQPYGDASAIMARLVQWYGDAATARRVLDQLYGDALMLRTSLAQEWSYPALLTRVLVQRYGISGHALRRVAVQQWAIKGIEMVRAGLDQPWLLMDGSGREDRVEATVTVGGAEVSFTHINIEASRDQYCLSCEIHLASQADYVRCRVMDELVVRAAGTDFLFFVESRQRRRGHPTAEYTIHGLSRTALLDAPYAEPVPLDAVLTGMASEITAGLAPGYAIDWRTVDWHIPADTLMPGDQTPLAVIRQIAAAVGAVIQTEPDGTMVVESAYPVPVPDWPTATVGHTLSDAMDFFSAGETFDHRPGHNRFLVGDQMASQDTLRLEAEDESAFARIIRAYQTPWVDDFDLRHTGGDWVALEPEGIEERVIEDEIVEIVSGTGNTRYPIYERLAMAWLRQDLGTVTVSEDGTVRAAIEGESLLRITYRTRCRRYRMTDQRAEQVQVVAETMEG